jgi:hypothetical protein
MHRRLALFLSCACLPVAAHATNWLQLQGTEPPNAPAFKLWGFLQPTYISVDANPISGLAGPASGFNGKYTVPNLVGPDLNSNHRAQFFRARLGARGRLNDKIDYFVLGDAGRNAATAKHHVVLTDASVTFSYIPGARIRAGLFKLPTGEEALTAVQVAYPYVYFSNASQNLLVENQVQFNGGTFSANGASTANMASGGSGFRDWGVQVFDWFDKGPWEFSYAAMVSNGSDVNNWSDNNSDKDITLRFQTSYIFNKSKGPNREDFSAYIWHQGGKRTFNGQDFDRTREGVGFKYLKGNWHVSGEDLRGDGVIVGGPNPPFVGQPIQVGLNEKADGWYLEGGWRFLPKWEVDVRRDEYHRMTENASLERDFKTTTLGMQYFINKNTHVTLNYEWRSLDVPHADVLPAGPQRNNAEAIAANLGNRTSLQLTWVF